MNLLQQIAIFLSFFVPSSGGKPSTQALFVDPIPRTLDAQIDLAVNAILSEISASFFRDLTKNPRHVQSEFEMDVSLQIEDRKREFTLDFPANFKTLDDRLFQVTSSFSDKLKVEIACSIIISRKFKSQAERGACCEYCRKN